MVAVKLNANLFGVSVMLTQIYPALNFAEAINVLHANGMEVYAHFATMVSGGAGVGDVQNRPYDAMYLGGKVSDGYPVPEH